MKSRAHLRLVREEQYESSVTARKSANCLAIAISTFRKHESPKYRISQSPKGELASPEGTTVGPDEIK